MPTVALYCFFPVGHWRWARKQQVHFSSRLTLSVEFSKYHVGPVALHLHSTITELHSSSCSVAVSIFERFFTCSLFPVSLRSVLTSSTKCYYLLLFWSCLWSFLSTDVSHCSSSAPAHTQWSHPKVSTVLLHTCYCTLGSASYLEWTVFSSERTRKTTWTRVHVRCLICITLIFIGFFLLTLLWSYSLAYSVCMTMHAPLPFSKPCHSVSCSCAYRIITCLVVRCKTAEG